MYKAIARPLLYRMPAELAHQVTFGALRGLAVLPGAKLLLRSLLGPRDTVLRSAPFGVELSSPVGLAAGFDKDAKGFEVLASLGFGFVEIGTVTGHPQAGNPKPRLFRLPKDRAIVNRMGFNNAGSAAAAKRLSGARHAIVGINIGKTKVVPEAEAVGDYVLSASRLGRLADYFVVNVSSPNTPGLRDLQAVQKLEPLLLAVQSSLRGTGRDVPLFVKIAPDLSDDDVDAVADLACRLGLTGIIATNTTVRRDGLRTSDREVEALGAGGLSGAPLHARSLAVLKRLRARVGDSLVLISVGGIETPEQAYERIVAGASLVQVYTGLIYHGPLFLLRLNRGIAKRLRKDGFASLSQAVGSRVTTSESPLDARC